MSNSLIGAFCVFLASCTLIYDTSGVPPKKDGGNLPDGGAPGGGNDAAPIIGATDARPPTDAPGGCSILAQDCSSESDGCYWNGYRHWGDCAPAGILQNGEPCTAQSHCAPGYVCTESFCRQICSSVGGACGPGYCLAISEDTEMFVRACLP